MKDYTIKDYKELIEKTIKDYDNPLEVPNHFDPESWEALVYRRAKQEALTYALEMLPEIKE